MPLLERARLPKHSASVGLALTVTITLVLLMQHLIEADEDGLNEPPDGPVLAFQPVIELRGGRDSEFREHLYDHLLACIASHRVGNRPGRFEPRKRKRRFKLYDFLNKPRHEAKLDMLKGVSKN